MIIGTNSRRLKEGRIKNVQCPGCGIETDMTYSVYSKYAHVSAIPIFPIGKIVITECINCKRTYDLYKLSFPIIEKFQKEELANPAKPPVWLYSGIIIISAIMVVSTFIGMQSKKEGKINIANPKPGDVYHIKIKQGHYTSARVSKVFKDSLYLSFNDMEATSYLGVDDINTDKHYNESESIARKEIEKMYEDNTIYEIDRQE